MAFFRNVGNMLRQSASKIMGAKLHPRVPKDSIFQNIRCSSIPSSKLFNRVRVIMDKVTGWSRGFCITYPSIQEASHAIKAMDGQTLHGRKIKVRYVKAMPRGRYCLREDWKINFEDILDIGNHHSSDGNTFSGDRCGLCI